MFVYVIIHPSVIILTLSSPVVDEGVRDDAGHAEVGQLKRPLVIQ